MKAFTFQYGQIYYGSKGFDEQTKDYIYIPIWLDLLSLYKAL